MANANSENYLMEKIMSLTPPPNMMQMQQKMNPEACSDHFKLSVVQFFIQYYTVRMFELAPDNVGVDPNAQVDLDKVEAFKADQTRDMEHAWKLLRANFRSSEMEQTAKLLMIEIGQRLEDSVKLAEALTHLDSTLEHLGGIANVNFSPQALMM